MALEIRFGASPVFVRPLVVRWISPIEMGREGRGKGE